jgi:hypothetical protein
MRFSDILHTSNALELDLLVEDDKQAVILTRMSEPEIALKIMRSGLWASWLFTQQTIPAYASHVFKTLTTLPPVDDELGCILAGVAGVLKGELYTNNIYGNAKECHCHYQDLVAAYLSAGGKTEDVEEVLRRSQNIAGDRRGDYGKKLLTLLQSPLATFILVPAIEKSTPKFFETVAHNLCRDSRFDKYRQFVEKHIELDRGEHSSVTMDWLAYICSKKCPTSGPEVTQALDQVITVMQLGKGSSFASSRAANS